MITSLRILCLLVALSAIEIARPSGSLSQTQKPTKIEFRLVPGDNIIDQNGTLELAVGTKKRIKAVIRDQNDNTIPNASVVWQLSNAREEGFILLGATDAATNSIEVAGLSNSTDPNPPGEITLIARYGDVVGAVKIKYIPETRTGTVLTTSISQNGTLVPVDEILVRPGESTTVNIKATKDDDSKAEILKISIKPKLLDSGDQFLVVTTDDSKKTVTVTGKYGTPSKPTPLIFSLQISAASGSKLLGVRYDFNPVRVVWDIVPPNIVGDNFGRTIRNDYYCIEVMVQNFSGDDIALAGFAFDMGDSNDPSSFKPDSDYSTVHGSLARRKLTYPRTAVLAAITTVGEVMTGFNPFFHNLNHSNNFSYFINIISNPIEKGLDRVWKDAYPDELARFEQDVLKDDKIIANGAPPFKTKIFIPKRSVFPTSADGNKNDLNDVRDALGKLVVFGYKFHRGGLQTLTQTPPK
jgi:hypothetical protein